MGDVLTRRVCTVSAGTRGAATWETRGVWGGPLAQRRHRDGTVPGVYQAARRANAWVSWRATSGGARPRAVTRRSPCFAAAASACEARRGAPAWRRTRRRVRAVRGRMRAMHAATRGRRGVKGTPAHNGATHFVRGGAWTVGRLHIGCLHLPARRSRMPTRATPQAVVRELTPSRERAGASRACVVTTAVSVGWRSARWRHRPRASARAAAATAAAGRAAARRGARQPAARRAAAGRWCNSTKEQPTPPQPAPARTAAAAATLQRAATTRGARRRAAQRRPAFHLVGSSTCYSPPPPSDAPPMPSSAALRAAAPLGPSRLERRS